MLLRGHETILVVEDDASLRGVVVKNLRLLGYRVLEAANGPEALAMRRQPTCRIDLLLTDMVMPAGMTGLELARQLRGQEDGLKVILSSGYNTEMVPPAAGADAGAIYLQKPYELEVLAKTIRACLDTVRT